MGWHTAANVLLVGWITLSLPAVLLQLALAVDLANYVLTRRVLVYPFLHAKYASELKMKEGSNSVWMQIWRGLIALATVTSPFSGIATWLCHVLGDLPESTHIPVLSGAELRRPTRTGERRHGLRRAADKRLVVSPPSPLLDTLAEYLEALEREKRGRLVG
jgi:hypothetical protein